MAKNRINKVVIRVIFFLIMIGIGVLAYLFFAEDKSEYYDAKRIENEAEFQESLQKNIGKAWAGGKISTEEGVNIPPLRGKYLYIRQAELEEDSEGELKTTGYVEYYPNKVEFMGVEFDGKQFEFSGDQLALNSDTIETEYLNSVDEKDDRYMWATDESRYTYYVIPVKSELSIFADFKDGMIQNPKDKGEPIKTFPSSDFDEAMKSVDISNLPIIIIIIAFLSIITALLYIKLFWRRDRDKRKG